MPESAKSDLAALNDALETFTTLQVAIQIVSEHISYLQRNLRIWEWELVFNSDGEFAGVSRKGKAGEVEYSADSIHCVEIGSKCEWLPKHAAELWEAQPKADKALSELPPRLTEKLDALTGSPWVASVRLHCIDKVLAWPGERHHQTSYAAEKVHGSVTELLEKAEKYDPFPTWAKFEDLILGYKSQLIAVRDAVLTTPAKSAAVRPNHVGGLVSVNIRQVIEEANRAAVAWHILAGCEDGRLLKMTPDGSDSTHSGSMPKCLRAWYVPNTDDRTEQWTIQREGDEPRIETRSERHIRAFRFEWETLNESRRRIISLLNNGDIDLLDCEKEIRDCLRILWIAIAAIPAEPPTFRITGRQDFYSKDQSILLGWQADTLESFLQHQPANPTAPQALQGPADLPGDLDSEEAAIVALLRDVGHRLTTSRILSEFAKRNEVKAESTTKLKLSQLVRRKVLNNLSDSRPRGYGFSDWP